MNNAGLMAMPEATTADGSMQFGVNHLGTTSLLLAPCCAPRVPGGDRDQHSAPHGPAGRRVQPAPARPLQTMAHIGQAKLANFHLGLGLDRQLRAASATTASLIAHPGLSNTDLQARTVREGGGGASAPFFRHPSRSARHRRSPGRPAPAPCGHQPPAARGGEFYAPRFVDQRTAGAATRAAPLGPRPGDRHVVAGLASTRPAPSPGGVATTLAELDR